MKNILKMNKICYCLGGEIQNLGGGGGGISPPKGPEKNTALASHPAHSLIRAGYEAKAFPTSMLAFNQKLDAGKA